MDRSLAHVSAALLTVRIMLTMLSSLCVCTTAADVLTIENSRSGNEMIAALGAAGYSRDIGPGVYDVHSPVVPTVDFIKDKIR